MTTTAKPTERLTLTAATSARYERRQVGNRRLSKPLILLALKNLASPRGFEPLLPP